MSKQYCISADDITRLIPNMGGAIITDHIAVDGHRVGFMRRSDPDDPTDSGWAFYSGQETQEYLDDVDNASVMSLNTIANFDHEIISFLTLPPGSEIQRNAAGKLTIIKSPDPNPPMRLLGAAPAGEHHLPGDWQITTTKPMVKRLDDGDLVIWQPGFTVWISSLTAPTHDAEQHAARWQKNRADLATELRRDTANGLVHLIYHLVDTSTDPAQKAVLSGGFFENRIIHLTIYYDEDADREAAIAVAQSLKRLA